MPQTRFTAEQLEELNLLCLFNPDSTQEGIKVHAGTAAPEAVAAVARLHAKGLVTQTDGGYLTALGREAAAHAQALRGILDPVELTT